MDNSFQTSFIPKKPIITNARTTRPPTSIFTVLSFLLLVIMGVSSLGLFLYKNYLIKQKEVLSASLSTVRDSFEKDTINELELYDKRVSAAKQILGSHIVFSPMFALIGNLTLPTIQYTKFDQKTDTDGFTVKMSGVSQDYKSIALQADVFNTAKGRSFKNVVFSNLTKDKNNNVTFDISFNVDPDLLSYEKNMASGLTQSRIQTTTPTPQAPTTQTAPTPEPATKEESPATLPETDTSTNVPTSSQQ